uniref:Glycosyltransferase n=1 Tax=Miconia microphysca TaxID=3021300 RepID=A0AA50KJ72_9MYRT|nr:UGT75AB1 [Miconia microphysca]
MAPPNFLLVTFPGQGHINPSLRFAERLIRIGCHVTFTTALSARRRMSDSKSPPPEGLSFATFSDGYDEGIKEAELDLDVYMKEITRRGPETLRELILEKRDRGTNFTHIFFTILMPWAADVAQSLGLRSTLVWIQPATVFDIYYYHFNGYDQLIRSSADAAAADNGDSREIRLPGMLPMTSSYFPSFLASGNQYHFSLPVIKRHFEILNSEKTGTMKPKVLVNTFEELEAEAVKAIDELNVIPVGPFIPLAFLDEQHPTDTSLGGDLFQKSRDLDYIDWLNKQQAASVIYISFGSLSLFSRPQKEEMAKALIAMGRPFLWVIRKRMGEEEEEDDKLSYEEELSKLGMIVPWCSQVEVLSNPSVGCFVTHCGWNSTSESLVCGVPMVGFPQWSDQQTNAKLVEEVWRTGVQVGKGNGEGVVEAGEIERCLEVVLGDGEKGRELRGNAKKWGELAKKAAKDGGSSDNNLRRFVDGLVKGTASSE